MNKYVSILLLLAFSCKLFSQISFDNYANIHTIGIGLDTYYADPEDDLSIEFEYKMTSANNWSEGFEMVRTNTVHVNLYNSSIFDCSPQTEYIIKATLSDPTTPALNGNYSDTITTQALLPISSFSTTYYVSPDGNGMLFTTASPGKLQDALNSVQAGERIILLAGTYTVGDIQFNKSGTLTEPIIIQGEAEGTVIIDGSDSISAWNNDASVLGYKATISNPHCNVVIADGIRLYPHKSLKELKYHKIPWESNCRDAAIDGFFRSGNNNTLRLKFRDDSDPNSKTIKVGKYNQFIELNGSQNINFSKLTFRYYGSENKAAVILKNSGNIRFDACNFEFNDIGILLNTNTNNVVIDNCEFSDGYGDWNFWRMKATYEGKYLISCSGNKLASDNFPGSNLVNLYNNRSLEKGGVFVSGDYSGRGLIIKNSSFHDMVQGLSIRPQSWWTDNTGKTAEIDFYNNEVYNCSEDGLESDVFPRNVRIWNNTFHDVNASISIASGADGPIYIFRNTFYNFSTDTTWISSFGNFTQGRPIKINSGNSGTSLDNTGQLYFLHNTVYAKDLHYSMDLLKPSNQTWKKMTFFNNILRADDQYSLRLRATNFGHVESDFNNFYNSLPSLISYNNNSFSSLESFSGQYNLDLHSLELEPSLANPTLFDFSLSSTSPNIDAGLILPGLNTNYSGAAPDIGAIEYITTMSNSIIDDAADIQLFPNPFSTVFQLNINRSNIISKANLRIFNLAGKLVHSQEINSTHSIIDTNSFPRGMYLVKLTLGDKQYVDKIVKSW